MSPGTQKVISIGIATLGAALVLMMITTEGELGALPLGMVVAGAVGYVAGWARQRASRVAPRSTS